MSSRWVTFHLRTMTPLFSGDDPTSPPVDSPIRVPSIRGVLRYWFRAVAAAHGVTAPQDLWKAEEAVFGSTNKPSAIALRLSGPLPRSNPSPAPDWAAKSQHPPFRGAEYLLGQGLWDRDHLKRGFVAARKDFCLDVRFSGIAETDTRFMLSLWAWLTYGGLGARTRRGFGQLTCRKIVGDLPGGWMSDHFPMIRTADEWQTLTSQPIPPPIAALVDAEWSDRPQDPDASLPRIPTLSSRWWKASLRTETYQGLAETLDAGGYALRRFRLVGNPATIPIVSSPEWREVISSGNHQALPIAALGLPVGYHRPRTDHDEAFNTTVQPTRNTTQEMLRRASPLWLRPVRVDDKHWKLFTFVFWSELLPNDVELKLTGDAADRAVEKPTLAQIEHAWTQWISGKSRLPTNFYNNVS